MQRSPGELEEHAAWPSTSDATAGGSVWEIEEEAPANGEIEPCGEVVPSGVRRDTDGDDVYVAVGKPNSSMDALAWALKHAAKPTSLVYLVHVFPEVHHIPTPLGMLPKHQVSPQQVETHMSQVRAKRREMLQKFMNLCHSSKVDVDTVLIESDSIAKAVVDLIPVLNIKKLIVGTTKSNMRKLKKGNSKAEHIHKSAPHYCEVKIICDGKEVTTTEGTMLSSSPSNNATEKNKDSSEEDENKNSVSCICCSRKLM